MNPSFFGITKLRVEFSVFQHLVDPSSGPLNGCPPVKYTSDSMSANCNVKNKALDSLYLSSISSEITHAPLNIRPP
jgi:hypothetical protein